ncbi:MAG TPA: hypothetical protein VN444_07850, partial [Verrucomicrobiae bacterium]|nr:hypothetical protein [Verrucomicrobiae bacterium]
DAEKAHPLHSRFIEIPNVRMRFSEIGSTGGAFPFAKTHCKGERPHEVRVGTSSGFDSPAALPDGLSEQPAKAVGLTLLDIFRSCFDRLSTNGV